MAVWDALEMVDRAARVPGDETPRDITRELIETVRVGAAIGWSLREDVRAPLRLLVRRILRKQGCPRDKQEQADLLPGAGRAAEAASM